MRRTASQQITVAEQEALAVKLRAECTNYRDIAKTLGCSVSQVHRLVTRVLARMPVEDVDTMRRIESERLEAIHVALWPKVVELGDAQAAAVLVRASAARARLYGLDAPVQISAGEGSISVIFSPALQPVPAVEIEG